VSKKLNRDTFIERCKIIHGDRYDYSRVVFSGVMKKVDILCKPHGIFSQRGDHHMAGRGCPLCKNDNISKVHSLTNNEFLEKCKLRHADFYDYSKTLYISAKHRVVVTCPLHGDFNVFAWNHHKGSGCPACTKKRVYDMSCLGVSGFLKKAEEIHGDLYDYSLIKEYIGYKTKLPIICRKHGVFVQNPNNHISCAKGCPVCNTYSKSEKYINDILSKRRIQFTSQKTFEDFKNPLTNRPFRFDFYLNEINTVIEYDGKHHFESIPYWGGDEYLKIIKRVDVLKNEYCLNNSIPIFRINYKQNLKKELECLLRQLFPDIR